MKERKWVGWAGKFDMDVLSNRLKWCADDGSAYAGVVAFKTKGAKEDWSEDDWPPVKVEVIVREV